MPPFYPSSDENNWLKQKYHLEPYTPPAQTGIVIDLVILEGVDAHELWNYYGIPDRLNVGLQLLNIKHVHGQYETKDYDSHMGNHIWDASNLEVETPVDQPEFVPEMDADLEVYTPVASQLEGSTGNANPSDLLAYTPENRVTTVPFALETHTPSIYHGTSHAFADLTFALASAAPMPILNTELWYLQIHDLGTAVSALLKNHILKHNIRTFIISPYILKHVKQKATIVDHILKHNKNIGIPATKILKHGIEGIIIANHILKHNKIGTAIPLHKLKHNIRTFAIKTTILKHTVVEFIIKNTIFKHDNIEAIIPLHKLKHNIINGIVKNTILKHWTGGKVIQNWILKHNKRLAVNPFPILKHNKRNINITTHILKHPINTISITTNKLKHVIIQKIPVTHILKHNKRDINITTMALKHNIRSFAEKFWVMKHIVYAGVIREWRLYHNIGILTGALLLITQGRKLILGDKTKTIECGDTDKTITAGKDKGQIDLGDTSKDVKLNKDKANLESEGRQ